MGSTGIETAAIAYATAADFMSCSVAVAVEAVSIPA
jgi:hypothetical protein